MKKKKESVIKAVMLDLDGVIIDSNPAIVNAWVTTAKEYGYQLTNEEVKKYIIGASAEYTLGNIFQKENSAVRKDIHKKVDKREEQANYILINGVKDFIRGVFSHNIKVGIVTSSWPEKIANVIRQHNLHFFSAIVSREDVTHGKPDSEPYLLAMHKLGVEPEHSLVFEDSNNGISSATDAGALCISVNNPSSGMPDIRDFTNVRTSDNPHYYFYASRFGIEITYDKK